LTPFDVDCFELGRLPLVCICIPTYNVATTIRETLESILAQTYPNLVIHVSDNASSDGTLCIIESFSDSRLYVHSSPENIGAEGNFNRCIQLAEGKYTAIFHADDIYKPDIVAKQVAYLEANPKVGAAFTAATTIDAKGIASGVIGQSETSNSDIRNYDFYLLLKAILRRGNFIVCPSAMVRTQVYKDEIQLWRGDLFRSSADLDVWLRIAASHLVAILSQPLMYYRVDSKQFSSKVRMRIERADFFLVMDYYLCIPNVQLSLSDDDKRNLLQLDINDRLWRAFNQFTKGNLLEAKLLIRGVYNFETLRGAFTSRRNLLMLMASAALYSMIVLHLRKIGTLIVNVLRGKFNK
jgi:glycosyltransferase involved in cell wall biosynthesis